jgi:hypothetical protein
MSRVAGRPNQWTGRRNHWTGRRSVHRLAVTVPALIRVGEMSFTATLSNLGRGGAKLDTAAPTLVGAKVTLCCGTVVAEATVIWKRADTIGVNFDVPVSDALVLEQVSRSAALAERQLARPVISERDPPQ